MGLLHREVRKVKSLQDICTKSFGVFSPTRVFHYEGTLEGDHDALLNYLLQMKDIDPDGQEGAQLYSRISKDDLQKALLSGDKNIFAAAKQITRDLEDVKRYFDRAFVQINAKNYKNAVNKPHFDDSMRTVIKRYTGNPTEYYGESDIVGACDIKGSGRSNIFEVRVGSEPTLFRNGDTVSFLGKAFSKSIFSPHFWKKGVKHNRSNDCNDKPSLALFGVER